MRHRRETPRNDPDLTILVGPIDAARRYTFLRLYGHILGIGRTLLVKLVDDDYLAWSLRDDLAVTHFDLLADYVTMWTATTIGVLGACPTRLDTVAFHVFKELAARLLKRLEFCLP